LRGVLLVPRAAQLVEDMGEPSLIVRAWGLGVSGGDPLSGFARRGRPEVGPIPAERGDPLLARVLDVRGDDVSGVGFPTAGHRHVR
jgi:hypothetical protein